MIIYTGRDVNPLNMTLDDIDIVDIAHHLSNICRFGGATREHYSVAQHCVLVSLHVPKDEALAGLMHDAAEAYIGDFVAPLKELLCFPRAYHPSGVFTPLRVLENNILVVIFKHFNVRPVETKLVHYADLAARETEGRDLVKGWKMSVDVDPWPETIDPWSQSLAEAEFLNRFYQLWKPKK